MFYKVLDSRFGYFNFLFMILIIALAVFGIDTAHSGNINTPPKTNESNNSDWWFF